MHGLNTIIKINSEQQQFIDRVLTAPRPPEQNLLEVWLDFKREQQAKEEAKQNAS
jgi:hypothetical protein